MTLIYSNLAECDTIEGRRKGIGFHNHDKEFPQQAQDANWFKRLVPNPCFWRVAKLGDNAYITHGDLGDFWNDDKNWEFTKWIVGKVWKTWQLIRKKPSETSPAHNDELKSKMEAGYIIATAMLGLKGIYNHLHQAKMLGLYTNTGSFTHKGVITYALVKDMRLYLMKTTKDETTILAETSL